MNNKFEHIPAGNFKVNKAEPVTYQAFLGTCVGVALYDRAAKVVPDLLGLSFSDLPQLIDSIPISLFNKNRFMETA